MDYSQFTTHYSIFTSSKNRHANTPSDCLPKSAYMKYFQSPPLIFLGIAMLFWGYAIHRFATKSKLEWIAIGIGLLIVLAGFLWSWYQYKQWDDDE